MKCPSNDGVEAKRLHTPDWVGGSLVLLVGRKQVCNPCCSISCICFDFIVFH